MASLAFRQRLLVEALHRTLFRKIHHHKDLLSMLAFLLEGLLSTFCKSQPMDQSQMPQNCQVIATRY